VSCKVEADLSEAWALAKREFVEASQALSGPHIGYLSKMEFIALRLTAKRARMTSDNAKLALEAHRKEHGC
jgi:hypothetical protein